MTMHLPYGVRDTQKLLDIYNNTGMLEKINTYINRLLPKPILGNSKHIDKPFWIIFIFLIAISSIVFFSASSFLSYKAGNPLGPVAKQMTFMAIGIVAAYIIQFVPTWILRLLGYAMLGISILCLYLIIIPNSPFGMRVNEATRWFRLGPLSFQPSELAKLSLIIVIADLLARIKTVEDGKKYFFITLGLAGITIFPILIGNFSTAALVAIIVVFMWFLSNIPTKYILSTIGIGIVVLVSGFFIVKYGYIEKGKKLEGTFSRAVTWVKRVDEMFKEKNTNEAEFQITDYNRQRSIAKIAVMRGGRSPFGVLPGNSMERDFLPLAFADYIFAIYVEETGIVGVVILILLYLAILFRACYASNKYEDYTAMLMVMGLALMLTCQALISMAVAVGIGPVTGQPLPLISMGGTSMTITCLYFGIMMAVAREQNVLKAQEEETRIESIQEVPDIKLD